MLRRLRRLLRPVHIYNCIPFKPQLADRNEFISLFLCRLDKRGQVLLYLISVVMAEYYAAGVKLGDDRIQYGLCAAFFLPIDGVHRGSGLADLEQNWPIFLSVIIHKNMVFRWSYKSYFQKMRISSVNMRTSLISIAATSWRCAISI